MRLPKPSTLALIIALSQTSAVHALDGQIDYSFGDFAGRSVFAINDPNSATDHDSASWVVGNPNGTIELYGYITLNNAMTNTVFRTTPTGQADTSFFLGDAYRTISYPGLSRRQFFIDFGVHTGSKTVSVGNATRSVGNFNDTDDVAVCRYNAAGGYDTSFGNTGQGCTLIDTSPDPSQEYASGLAIDHSDRLVVLGDTGGFHPFLARFTPSGTYDTEFNGGIGLRPFEFPTLDIQNYEAVAIDPEGRIVVVGQGWRVGSQRSELIVARFDDGGTPDPGFAGDGWTIFPLSLANDPLPRNTFVSDVTVDAEGRIIVVGQTALPDNSDARAFFARVLPNGDLDVSFNGSGYRLDRGPQDQVSAAQQVDIDDQGRYLVGGYSRATAIGSATDTLMWRLLPNGSLDPRFDGDGRVYLDHAITYGSNDASDDFASFAFRGKDIIVTSNVDPNPLQPEPSDYDIVTVRLITDELLVDGFED